MNSLYTNYWETLYEHKDLKFRDKNGYGFSIHSLFRIGDGGYLYITGGGYQLSVYDFNLTFQL